MVGELRAAIWAELLKVRRSLVPWVTSVAFAIGGLVGGFFMFVLQDPGRARSMGLLGAKAQLSGQDADWAGYLALTAQIASIGGLMIFGLIMTWLFGREFADRTATDLLALPTSRAAIVVAKLLVALGWCTLLAIQIMVITLGVGSLLGLPGWSAGVVLHGLGTFAATGLLTFLLATGYGLVACIGRGYLPAVASMFGTVFAAQVIAAIGYGAWFPWSVPALLSGAAGADQAELAWPSIAGVILVGLAVGGATVLWWQRADHNR